MIGIKLKKIEDPPQNRDFGGGTTPWNISFSALSPDEKAVAALLSDIEYKALDVCACRHFL